MPNKIRLQIKTILIIFALLIPDLLFENQTFAQDKSKVRIALVYNASLTGYRYRDGIMNILKGEENLEIIDVAYIKPSLGEDTIKKLIRGNHVDVILGPTESEVFTKVYNTDGINDNKISVLSGLSTTGVGNESQGFFFRLNLEATSRVFEVWSYLNKFWISKIAVVYEDSEFGRNAELAFKELVRDSPRAQDYLSIPFISPESPRAEINNIIEQRPEVIGLFCDREDVQRLYRDIQLMNTSGVPYNPYFFSLIDIASIGEGLENVFFPSLKNYSDSANIDTITKDEVYILGQETARLFIQARKESGNYNDFSTAGGRVHFRNQLVGILRGESKSGITMNFLKMKNLGPPYLYRLHANRLDKVRHEKDINWLTMVRAKIKLVYASQSYKLILNLLIMFILTISVSTIEIRRSFPKKHVKIYFTTVFYYFLLAHLGLVLFLYIYLAETGRINYSDTLMTIIITITPSAFFKTTFFETRSGRSFGLEEFYKRIMASIDEKIMKSRYKKLTGLENIIAYSNSENSMRRALMRIYRSNPSKVQSAKMIQKMEEEMAAAGDFMNRRRVAARLIMRQFDREQLKAEGFVPNRWKYGESVDPVILIRRAAKNCAKDVELRKKAIQEYNNTLSDLEETNPDRYKELMDNHEKEKEKVMTKEGLLLVQLRLLIVLHGFDLDWLVNDLKIIKKDQLAAMRRNKKLANLKQQPQIKLIWLRIVAIFKGKKNPTPDEQIKKV